MILGTLEFSNGQKCQWNQYKKSCEAHQSCGECLSAYPDLSDDSRFGSPCVWCTNCGRGRCVPKGTNCTQFCLNDLASSWRRETLIEKSNQCPEMQCAASDCDKCNQLNRIGELKCEAFFSVANFTKKQRDFWLDYRPGQPNWEYTM